MNKNYEIKLINNYLQIKKNINQKFYIHHFKFRILSLNFALIIQTIEN